MPVPTSMSGRMPIRLCGGVLLLLLSVYCAEIVDLSHLNSFKCTTPLAIRYLTSADDAIGLGDVNGTSTSGSFTCNGNTCSGSFEMKPGEMRTLLGESAKAANGTLTTSGSFTCDGTSCSGSFTMSSSPSERKAALGEIRSQEDQKAQSNEFSGLLDLTQSTQDTSEASLDSES